MPEFPLARHQGDRFWLAEGFHRLAAGLQAQLAELPCDVRQGGLRDAILHSAGANADHGLRRINDDKRRAVLMLLQDEEWGKWTAREIARCCAVSHDFVSRLRGLLSSDDSEPAPRTYRDRHGNVSQMDTARIGRQQPEPDPPAPEGASAPVVPDQLADALARQFRREAEQMRGPHPGQNAVASDVVALRRLVDAGALPPDSPTRQLRPSSDPSA